MALIDLRDAGSGLYVHVPFCLSKCDYCGFFSVVPENTSIINYLDCLQKEAHKRLSASMPKFKTIFIGGGNPTCLGLDGLRQLYEIVLPFIDQSILTEFTFESNPETISAEIVAFLAGLPAIRLSMGVQRLQDDELKILGRRARLASVYRALDLTCSRLPNVGVDLILGVPDCPSVDQSLQRLINDYPLKHVSAYFLTIEPETPMQKAISQGLLPSPEDIGPEELFQVREVLVQAGFEHYEISNYARPGWRCQHNLNYWQPCNYAGLGPSAVSTCNELRCTNPADLRRWLAGESPAVEHLSPTDRRNEFVMLRLRLLQDGLNMGTLEKHFGCQSSEFYCEFERLLSEGLLQKIDESRVKLTDRGLIMADDVMASLFI